MKAYPNSEVHGQLGMDLRDYFAAKAMQAVMACDEAESYEWIAKKAYNLADFMLIARKQ